MPTCLPLDCCNESDFNYTAYDYTVLSIAVDIYPLVTPGWAGTIPSGTVSGAGTYNVGDTVTLVATPNIAGPDPSKLYGWYDEVGNRISDSTTYTFTATVSRHLTCVFTLI